MNKITLEGNMKRLISLVVFCCSFVLLCPCPKAQWYEPYGLYPWEGAEVQRLTFDTLPNKMIRLYVDDQDKLHLFYLEGVRDTATGFVYDYKILYKTKEQGGVWSEPEEIRTPVYVFGQNRKGGLWMDTNTGIIHILYPTLAGDLYDDTLYYTNSTIPDYEFTKIDSMPGQQWRAQYASFDMDFDHFGNVHVAWHMDFDSSTSNWYRVVYANNSTGQWVKQVVSPAIDLGGFESGATYFAVEQDGIAHIVYQGEPYCDLECEAFYVRNDSLNGTNWITDTLPKPSRPLWYYRGGLIEVDQQDTVHLITGGCIQEDCHSAGKTRTFYHFKESGDSVWQGNEQIPDTMLYAPFRIDHMFIDQHGIPWLSYALTNNEVFFTDRKQGDWEVPYLLVGWNQDLSDSFMVDDFSFVLDSQGKGHAVFAGFNFAQGSLDNDSVEIYYFSSYNSSVDSSPHHIISDLNLFQNYPNPFNSSTIITYQIQTEGDVYLRIYDLLGREVRELVKDSQEPGFYRINWDGKNDQGKDVASGIYFYLLQTGDRKEGKKMLLIK
jgi:hypothetical protein